MRESVCDPNSRALFGICNCQYACSQGHVSAVACPYDSDDSFEAVLKLRVPGAIAPSLIGYADSPDFERNPLLRFSRKLPSLFMGEQIISRDLFSKSGRDAFTSARNGCR